MLKEKNEEADSILLTTSDFLIFFKQKNSSESFLPCRITLGKSLF